MKPKHHEHRNETRTERAARRDRDRTEFLHRRVTVTVRDKYGNDEIVYGPMQLTTNSASRPNRDRRRAKEQVEVKAGAYA